jgi:hypothetical protein
MSGGVFISFDTNKQDLIRHIANKTQAHGGCGIKQLAALFPNHSVCD